MNYDREIHYCRHCKLDFKINLDPELTGDYLLECPTVLCKHQHYRYFHAGTAKHCDIGRRTQTLKVIYGYH